MTHSRTAQSMSPDSKTSAVALSHHTQGSPRTTAGNSHLRSRIENIVSWHNYLILELIQAGASSRAFVESRIVTGNAAANDSVSGSGSRVLACGCSASRFVIQRHSFCGIRGHHDHT